jgi:GntR family transcriptional regulator/MocR family aminotransferase
MILFRIDQQSEIPIYKQIVNGVINVVENQTIKPGFRLPTTRALSENLGVNRSTVYIAYQYLNALGYIESKPGSYTTIRKRNKIVNSKTYNSSESFDWDKASNHSSQEVYDYYLKHEAYTTLERTKDLINFTQLGVDKRLFPVEDFRRSMNNVLFYQGKDLLGYGDNYGFLQLREYIASRLQTHGISVVSDNILITNGCQQALELVIKLLVSPGKKVVIEAPTYIDMIPLLKYYKADVIEVPMLNNGMDLNHLEQILKKKKPAFIYTIPNFHNPTGITTSQIHRENLLSLAEKYQVPIIEDGFEEEMKYFGKVVLPIKSMDKNQIVIYIGTFSKALFAGIRIGWLVGDKNLIQKLASLKKYGDLGVSPLTQAAISNFCQTGYYDLHIRRIQRAYRKRMLTAFKMMKEEFPENVTYTKPDGGYTIWLSLKECECKEESMYKIFINNGIMISPGSLFFFRSTDSSHFRISIASLDEAEIIEGIKRLGAALRAILNNQVQKQIK